MPVERLGSAVFMHGESPVWCPRIGSWLAVDLLAGDIVALTNDGNHERHHVDDVVTAIRWQRDSGFIVALERRVALLNDSFVVVQRSDAVWTDPSLRMNDGGCDPGGAFYCGSMAYDEAPGRGALYRFDADLRPITVLGEVTISNGIDWALGGECAYYVDSATGRIDVLVIDDGHVRERRTLAVVSAEHGIPDGLTVDEEGHIWVALWGGGSVWCFSPEGECIEQVPVPTPYVTACSFGGPELDRLLITSSRLGYGDAQADPLAGAVFVGDVGARGRIPHNFSGLS